MDDLSVSVQKLTQGEANNANRVAWDVVQFIASRFYLT